MAAEFTIREDGKGKFYWTFQAHNNEVVARSSESYATRDDCLHSIFIVRTLSPKVTIWEKVGEDFNMVTDKLD